MDTHDRIDMIAEQVDGIKKTLDDHHKAIQDNTEITREIRDVLIAGKTGARMVKWIGGLGAGLVGMAAGWQWLKAHL
jgi:hypothetical protein